jgi:hypothetical protein
MGASLEQLALLLAGHLSIAAGSVLIVGLLELSLPLSAILAVRMANVTANVIATATIMSLVTMEGPPALDYLACIAVYSTAACDGRHRLGKKPGRLLPLGMRAGCLQPPSRARNGAPKAQICDADHRRARRRFIYRSQQRNTS